MNKYASDLKIWKKIKNLSEDKAIALLMGLEPESWLRYFGFCEKNSGKDLSKLSAKDRAEIAFVEEYRGFLKDRFDFIPELSRYAVLRGWVSDMKQRGRWNGDLSAYARTLYDNGIIFKSEIISYLGLTYSPDSWAMKFYEGWHGKKAWTLAEAVYLFVGKNPRVSQEKFSSFIDLRQHGGLKYADLEDLVERHIAAKKITQLSDNKSFKPENIVEWLIKNTQYSPPPCLTEILFPAGERRAGLISPAALERAYKAYVERSVHLMPPPSWQDDQKAMTEALGVKPTDVQIKEIRKRLAPESWKRKGRRKSV